MKRFFSHWIVKNLLLLIGVSVLLVLGFSLFLRLVTDHGTEVTVPDLRYMSVQDADALAHDARVKVAVVDSIYNKRLPRGYVDSQLPQPGKQVKKGRKIRLVINAKNPRTVAMPELRGMSLRQAMNELSAKHLILGELIYQPDMATNLVLDQKVGSRSYRAGRTIECGSVVNLVLGLNASSANTSIPSVIGRAYDAAVQDLKASSLNVRTVVYDESVRSYEDTLKAIVYRQGPTASQLPVRKGSSVSLYLTVNPDRLSK